MPRRVGIAAACAMAAMAQAQSGGSAGRAADIILAHKTLKAEDAKLVREVLVRVSADERTFAEVLQFCALAHLYEGRAKKTNGDIFRALINAEDKALWMVVEQMGAFYFSESHLPSVRYMFSEPQFGERVKAADKAYFASREAQRLESWYFTERRLGSRPDDAFALTLQDMDQDSRRGLSFVRAQLRDFGIESLTGYSAEQADRDLAAYLESRYATAYPNARDIAGVRRCSRPTEFIGQRAMDAMIKDRAHLMRAVDAVINAAIKRFEELRSGGDRPIPSAFPTMEQIGLPGRMRDQTGWLRFDRVPSQGSMELSVVEWKERDVRKFRKDFDGVRDRHNGHGLRYDLQVVSDPRHDGYTGFSAPYLKPNTEYEVVFFPWYWADSEGAAYVAPGSSVVGAPAAGRTYLPANDGGLLTVRYRGRTDSQGRLKFVFVAEGRCAFSLGSLWLRPVR